MAKPHPENAPGDFYVEDGCCLACGMPEHVAPEIFGRTRDERHCVVRRQPESRADLDKVIEAMLCAEVDCIRYCGGDPAVKRRVAEAGHRDNCDAPLPGVGVKRRNYVTFRPAAGNADSADALAARFRTWLLRDPSRGVKLRPVRRRRPASVVYTWSNFSWNRGLFRRPDYHRIDFAAVPGSDLFAAQRRPKYPDHAMALARGVDAWLRGGEGATEIRWLAPDDDPVTGAGSARPF